MSGDERIILDVIIGCCCWAAIERFSETVANIAIELRRWWQERHS